MLPTIIFFLALLFSYLTISTFIKTLTNFIISKSNMTYDLTLGIITCILWSYLFYLLH